MKRIREFSEAGTIFAPASLLGAAALLAILAAFGITTLPEQSADMRIEPLRAHISPGETFTARLVITSPTAVNVFSGELVFDPQVLEVSSIDYNTSIADLWAEKPWYENGAGTLSFIGGTTREGGFVGEGELLTIYFTAKAEGAGSLAIRNAHILQHDGLGTNVVMRQPIDALFVVEKDTIEEENLIRQNKTGTTYVVRLEPPSTDLNNDGKQSIADISIFLLNMSSTEARFDFNQDGDVNTRDLSILLQR